MKLICGLDRLQNDLEEFIRQGEEYVRDAATGRSLAHCLREPSLMRRVSTDAVPPNGSISIALDVGGTHTKAALAHFAPAGESWRVLFDIENADLLGSPSAKLPIESFCTRVAAQCGAAITQSGYNPTEVRSVSVVWSNQIESAPVLKQGVAGVTGLVNGIAAGTYRKSEWFVSGLHDGYDLGTLFLESFQYAGFTPQVFLMGNDTVFTLTALPGAHAGVVASSGGNCTDVGVSGDEQDFIFNTELGSLYKIASAHLSEGDLALAAHSGVPVALEDLLSGKWLPALLDQHVVTSARAGVEELQELAAAIGEAGHYFTMPVMANILSPQSSGKELPVTGNTTSLVREMASHIVTRAGVAAGALCYFSVFNQICAGADGLTVALDSAMARYVPGYLTSLESTWGYLLNRRGLQGSVVLLQPTSLADGQQISVPVMGAIRAGALWS
jgi:hypothetical protein